MLKGGLTLANRSIEHAGVCLRLRGPASAVSARTTLGTRPSAMAHERPGQGGQRGRWNEPNCEGRERAVRITYVAAR